MRRNTWCRGYYRSPPAAAAPLSVSSDRPPDRHPRRRYRPVDEVVREMEECGSRTVSINDADFFGTPDRPKEVMRALKGRGFQWQAGVTSKLAQDDRMLELAAQGGCALL